MLQLRIPWIGFSSLSNTGYSKPRTRLTINLAPGDLRKEGAAFDLPIALSLLASTGQMKNHMLEDYLIAGELALSGATRHVRGGLAMAMLAKKIGKKVSSYQSHLQWKPA